MAKKKTEETNPLAMHPEEVKMLPKGELIRIRGAKENNLKDLDVNIPRNRLVR